VWETTFEDLERFAQERDLDARPFLQRRSEFEILFHHLKAPAGRSLEVGCGDGFFTALLARGLDAPGRLRRALDASNLHFLGCRGEALCFADATFDLVLSSYVLEHVRDRPEAVREMKRVAKEDGVIVALVPSWMERVYAPLRYYPSMIGGILRSGFRFLMQRIGSRRAPAAPSSPAPLPDAGGRRGGALEGLREKLQKFFGVYHPTFPFPRPHGFYRSSSEELLAHRFGRWERLFEGEGLVIERAFATRIAPTCLLEMISDGTDRAVQRALAGPLKQHGEGRWMRAAAYSLCFVLRRRPPGA
jgi:SAM-dependent methyltransferase